MPYPNAESCSSLTGQLQVYADLQHEDGARGIPALLKRAERDLARALKAIRALSPDPALARREPSELATIRCLRPSGPRRLWGTVDLPRYRRALEGAFLARCAGCTLGAPVEGQSVESMEQWARHIGDRFPPVNYWSASRWPDCLRYGVHTNDDYTRGRIRGVPVDDDITYTLLGLLIAEKYGPGFTVADVGRAWQRWLPIACTAEDVALKNLAKGIPAERAGAVDNPYCEWIGADIRSDPWAYIAPGWPEKAAELAWRDAYLSHRRQGIHGAMFFAAAISAAFAVDSAMDALRIGLTEIPRDCRLAHDIRWAMRQAPRIRNYRQARDAVDRRFPGMNNVHTNNNACLTVFGLAIGGKNVTRVIGETVAMGLDNDCTAATAGSIIGAIVGKAGIAPHWWGPFRGIVYSYLKGRRRFRIADVLKRFERQAMRMQDA